MTRLAIAFLAALCGVAFPALAAPVAGPDGKIVALLRGEVVRYDSLARLGRPARSVERHALIPADEDGMLPVMVALDQWDAAVVREIAARGAVVVRTAPDFALVECRVPADAIRQIAALPAVRHVRPVVPPVFHTGSVATVGDTLMGSYRIRANGYEGNGVKVGVISDGITGWKYTWPTGDLPKQIVAPDEGYGAEGTAMLEIVHDIAPKAALHFSPPRGSELGMRQAIRDLARAGCRAIVDDIGWFYAPLFEDGPLAQIIDSVAAAGIVYATSAGNAADEHYAASYTPARGASRYHAWDLAADSGMALALPPTAQVAVVLQWDEPYGAAATDLDLYLCADPALRVRLATSADPQAGNGYPYEVLYYQNVTDRDQAVWLAISRYDGPPRDIELFFHGGATIEYRVPAGSVHGHARANGAISVGAIDATDPGCDDIAYYSSRGPVRVNGAVRQKPDLVAPSAVRVTGTGGFPTVFTGTSAAAPHVAGVAALLFSAHPAWTGADVRAALTGTARDLGLPGWDGVYGYGFVRADLALGTGSSGPTNVSGDVATTTWTRSGSPYRIAGPTRVPTGQTLTVEPGIDVLFDADVPLVIEGAIRAAGTASDSIRFLPGTAAVIGGNAEWGGIRITGGDSSALRYVRISGALGEGVRPDYLGGALYVAGTGTRFRADHCVLSHNRAAWGGAFYARDSAQVVLADCAIRDNIATDTGGGIRVAFCPDTVRLVRCTIGGNTALTGDGGAIAIRDAAFSLEDCAIEGNEAAGGAGGVDLLACGIRIAGCVIDSNAAVGSGGGLRLVDCRGAIDRCRIAGNASGSYGGGAWIDRGNVRIGMTVVGGNTAAADGGGIAATNGAISVDGCTIANNAATSGDGIFASGATGTVANTIAWENAPGSVVADGGLVARYSLVAGGWNGCIDADPLFADAGTGDWRLGAGSPALDAGDPRGPLDPDATRRDLGALYRPNPDAPEWSQRPDLAVTAGAPIAFTISALDPRNRPLAYRMTSGPATAAFDAVARRFEWPSSAADAERTIVEFSATNGIATVYKRVAIAVLSPVAIAEARPAVFSLAQNSPNPLNPSTVIRFSLTQPGDARLAVYDVNGRLVRVLVDGQRTTGANEVVWDGRDAAGRKVACGVYVYRLVAKDGAIVRRMTLVR